MTNEPAERLRSYFIEHGWSIAMADTGDQPLDPFPMLADAALDAERRATVERIREATVSLLFDYTSQPGRSAVTRFLAILDAEAAAAREAL